MGVNRPVPVELLESRTMILFERQLVSGDLSRNLRIREGQAPELHYCPLRNIEELQRAVR